MKQIFKLIIILLATTSLQAQNISNSPYSRFGLGELQSNFTPTYSAMGSVGVGVYNPLSVNFNNPASYTSAFRQRFTMQAGGTHTTNMMQTADATQVTNFTNISHFLIGFPVTKWWGGSIGLLPYSDVAYSFNDETPAGELLSFEGQGGLSRFYIGNGFKPHKNISAGVNINYLFGNLSTARKVIFSDENILNARQTDESLITGLYYDFGIMLHGELAGWNTSFGATYNNGSDVDAERSVLTETFRLNNLVESVEDTVKYVTENGLITLPTAIGVGFSASNDQWLIAADYNMENWSEFQSFEESDNLGNSTKMAVGLEFTPDRKAINNYTKMIRYRFGTYTSDTYLQLKNQQLKEKAVSFGFGLPLKRSGTLLNLSAEFGQRGTTDEGLIKDNFARFKIGLVLSDIWFIKRKYD